MDQTMKGTFLFAVDTATEEVIVSDSPKGSNSVQLVERVRRGNNEVLYLAVLTLTAVTQAPDFDESIFKAVDKICQTIYYKYKKV
jgi:hypothetical protein